MRYKVKIYPREQPDEILLEAGFNKFSSMTEICEKYMENVFSEDYDIVLICDVIDGETMEQSQTEYTSSTLYSDRYYDAYWSD